MSLLYKKEIPIFEDLNVAIVSDNIAMSLEYVAGSVQVDINPESPSTKLNSNSEIHFCWEVKSFQGTSRDCFTKI